jgi:hypothetical protein
LFSESERDGGDERHVEFGMALALQRVAEGLIFCNPRWSASQYFSQSALWLC